MTLRPRPYRGLSYTLEVAEEKLRDGMDKKAENERCPYQDNLGDTPSGDDAAMVPQRICPGWSRSR